jgi:N-formylmaleamate deformylase
MNYTEGDVKVNGVGIHYYRTGGAKPPFALLHGATDNGLCWTPVAEQLAADYDVIMIDAQGHGKSDRLDPAFSHLKHADQAVGLLKQLGVNKPIIMGHSMGAGTTVNIAVNYPDVPRAIVLEDPGWRMPAPGGGQTEEERKLHEGVREQMASYGSQTEAEVLARGRAEHPTWSGAELTPWAAAKKQFDPTLFERLRMDMTTFEALVPKIDVPTLLITASEGIVSEEAAARAAKIWKSRHPFKYVRIKGAGHNIRREQPAAFMKVLREFLKSLK